MRRRWHIIMLAMMILILPAGCKRQQGQQDGPDETPVPITGENPMTCVIRNFVQQRDTAFGLVANKLSEYRYGGSGEDHTLLTQTVMIPFADANLEFSTLIINSMAIDNQDEAGGWISGTENISGRVYKENGKLYLQAESTGEVDENDIVPVLRQSCVADEDDGSITAELYATVPDQQEVLTMLMEYRMQDGQHQLQIWYSLDYGNRYTLLRMTFTETNVRYGVQDESNNRPQSLFSGAFDETMFEDFITTVTYQNERVTIVNEGQNVTIN